MPVSLTQIVADTARVTLSVQGESVTVEYFPGRVTEKMFAVMNAFAHMDTASITSGFHDFNVMLASLIKSWDVFEDAAQTVVFPIDADRFAELPLGFRMNVLTAIMQDIRPEAAATQTTNS